jgi:hypothetical protein
LAHRSALKPYQNEIGGWVFVPVAPQSGTLKFFSFPRKPASVAASAVRPAAAVEVSIVADKDDPDRLLIRARRAGDIQAVFQKN